MFTDLDTHVDIHKQNGEVVQIHVFNNEIVDGEGVKVNEIGGDAVGDSSDDNLSEVVVHKNFNKNNRYEIYLYAYMGNYTEIRGECFFYHHSKGYLGSIHTTRAKYNLWHICTVSDNLENNIK